LYKEYRDTLIVVAALRLFQSVPAGLLCQPPFYPSRSGQEQDTVAKQHSYKQSSKSTSRTERDDDSFVDALVRFL
jgi:hypothetical protein